MSDEAKDFVLSTSFDDYRVVTGMIHNEDNKTMQFFTRNRVQLQFDHFLPTMGILSLYTRRHGTEPWDFICCSTVSVLLDKRGAYRSLLEHVMAVVYDEALDYEKYQIPARRNDEFSDRLKKVALTAAKDVCWPTT